MDENQLTYLPDSIGGWVSRWRVEYQQSKHGDQWISLLGCIKRPSGWIRYCFSWHDVRSYPICLDAAHWVTQCRPRFALLWMDLQQRLDLPSHFGIIVCSRMINPATGCSLYCVLTRQPFWKITSRKTSSCNYFSFIYGWDKSAFADIYGLCCSDLAYFDWLWLSQRKIIIEPNHLWSLTTFPSLFDRPVFSKVSF